MVKSGMKTPAVPRHCGSSPHVIERSARSVRTPAPKSWQRIVCLSVVKHRWREATASNPRPGLATAASVGVWLGAKTQSGRHVKQGPLHQKVVERRVGEEEDDRIEARRLVGDDGPAAPCTPHARSSMRSKGSREFELVVALRLVASMPHMRMARRKSGAATTKPERARKTLRVRAQ